MHLRCKHAAQSKLLPPNHFIPSIHISENKYGNFPDGFVRGLQNKYVKCGVQL